MDVLNHLKKTLRNLNRVALSKLQPADLIQIHGERAKLRAWLGGAVKLEEGSAKTIEDALRAYRQNAYLKGLRQIRLVCYGCLQTIDGDGYRLIDDQAQFRQLLDYVSRYKNRPAALRKFYHGLQSCYFTYDPFAPEATPSGRANWNLLKDFLKKHLDNIQMSGYTPAWVSTLTQNPNLFGENPSLPYEKTALDGDSTAFEELCTQLNIGQTSWLIRQWIFAVVQSAADMNDANFRAHIDSLLLLLHSYQLYAEKGLGLLLDRYAQCSNQKPYPALRDFAVLQWGNPWLPENKHKWKCTDSARDMLAYWLKLNLLKDFFTLLSNDGAQSRRLEFWSLYGKDIAGIYFALGNDAFDNRNMELFKFRKHAKGLITRLPEGKTNIHACIMQFPNHHVVEFNRNNNIAYIYDLRQGTPHFYLSKGWAEIGALSVTEISKGVEVSSQSIPLRHQDTPQLSWEGIFARELGPTRNAIKAFCFKYQCEYQDNSALDGQEWIRPQNLSRYGPEVWSVLDGWGFRLSNRENAYLRMPNRGDTP